MSASSSRGDRTVALGSLGPVVCRPTLRALEAIELGTQGESLTAVFRRLALSPSLRDVTTVLYETHLDGASATPGGRLYTRAEIGDAVLEVGLDTVREDCFELVRSAWSRHAGEDDEGNGERAGVETAPPGSPPASTPH